MYALLRDLPCADVESLVFFFVDQVSGPAGADRVAIGLVGAFRNGVFDGIENGLVVVGPGDGIDALGVVAQQFASAQIFHGQCELPEAGIVGGVGEQIAVVADVESPERHERLSLGQFVDVQQDFFGSIHAAFFAAMNGVLLAGFGSNVIEIAAFFVRHFDVRFLDAAQHFVVELLLQRFRSASSLHRCTRSRPRDTQPLRDFSFRAARNSCPPACGH